MPFDLDETVSAAQSGEPGAFDDLVRATYSDTYSLALRLVGNAEDAKDVAQDTYLRAYKSLSRFRGEADDLSLGAADEIFVLLLRIQFGRGGGGGCGRSAVHGVFERERTGAGEDGVDTGRQCAGHCAKPHALVFANEGWAGDQRASCGYFE